MNSVTITHVSRVFYDDPASVQVDIWPNCCEHIPLNPGDYEDHTGELTALGYDQIQTEVARRHNAHVLWDI